ncbi:MAG: type II toxin-antitoxin system RelE/ParE family toxin [Ekhidna sp.]|uniref:type II toxin-antitoxin system RelE/ParE family toxin n=1 Tax=Ekhidna sp. TaxID=2608089 RepID=UPI0032F079FA
MKYSIKIESEAKEDIQDAIDWYNNQKPGLGTLFLEEIKSSIEQLKINPHYQKRYSEVRCLPTRIFPFMIHFTLDEGESIVIVRGVFHTSINPKKWKRQ